MNGIHEHKAEPDGWLNLVAAVCPYMNIIPRIDCHGMGNRVLTALRNDCLYSMFGIRMEREGLTAHQAEDCTQGDEGDDKIADSFQEPGSGSRESLVCELLKKFHSDNLGSMITHLSSSVNNNLMFIVKLLSIEPVQESRKEPAPEKAGANHRALEVNMCVCIEINGNIRMALPKQWSLRP